MNVFTKAITVIWLAISATYAVAFDATVLHPHVDLRLYWTCSCIVIFNGIAAFAVIRAHGEAK